MQEQKLVERTIGGLHAALIKAIEEIPGVDCNTSVLDIGCGTGAWLERLASMEFSNLHGIDLDIRQFATDKATVTQANLDTNELNLGNKKFGLISSIEVLEHLENPGFFFYNLAKNLDDKGFILITTPDIHSVLCRFKFFLTGKLKQFDSKGDQTHIYPVLLTSLERILPRYQLEVVKKWSYPVDGGSITSRGALKIVAAILSMLLPNEAPGDNLCLLICKKQDIQQASK